MHCATKFSCHCWVNPKRNIPDACQVRCLSIHHVVKWTAVRLLLVLTAQLALATKQVDYAAAFVHADIDTQAQSEKGVFGLTTCRLDSCAALVGFNFRPK